jgi:hypothetical protein
MQNSLPNLTKKIVRNDSDYSYLLADYLVESATILGVTISL